MKLDRLTLLSKIDIPFADLGISIAHPSLKDIATIGEKDFFKGLKVLNLSKYNLGIDDKVDLDNITNFQILMTMINSQDMKDLRQKIIEVLQLFFPYCDIKIDENFIFLIEKTDEGKVKTTGRLNEENYDEFTNVLRQMYALDDKPEEEFNPANDATKKLIDKIKAGREKVRKQKNLQKQNEQSVLARYASILSISLNIDINQILNYSVFQLTDALQRSQLKTASDRWFNACIAGASGLDEPEDWLKELEN